MGEGKRFCVFPGIFFFFFLFFLCGEIIGKRKENLHFRGIYIFLLFLFSEVKIGWSKGEKVGNKIRINGCQKKKKMVWI